jgi:nucleoside-diphosphate-sugar epimerase
MGKKIIPRYGPPKIEPRATLSSCTKAKKLLGWKSKVDFEEGLRIMLKSQIGEKQKI